MGLDLAYIDGQTPLNEDEKEGLLIPTIATREELDEFEQLNIEETVQWSLHRAQTADVLFNEKFVRNLHKRMFGNVWSWAGKFRTSNKNLGVDKWQIPVALKDVCDDALYWVKHKTYSPGEIAIRFKHRLVSVHCFPNGNGRHSRLMADIIITNLYRLEPFSWGAGDLVHQCTTRNTYIQAVRMADNGNYAPLLEFARS